MVYQSVFGFNIPNNVYDYFIMKNGIKGESFTNQTKKIIFLNLVNIVKTFFQIGGCIYNFTIMRNFLLPHTSLQKS